jgi:ribosomal protein S18 acetylase RimI-like enzyme
MDKISFRTAAPEDVSILFEIKKVAYGDEFKSFNYAEYGYGEAIDDCNKDNPKEDGMFSRKWHEGFCSGHFGDWSLVIEQNSKIIGHIVAMSGQNQYFVDNYSEYDMSGNVNVIFSIYILPEYKNRGIGKMAIEYMEKIHPADKWILDTPKISPKNKSFYEKCGYKQGKSGSLNVYAKGF